MTEHSLEFIQADLTLRGWEPCHVGATGLRKFEPENGCYRVISACAWMRNLTWSGFTTEDYSTIWLQRETAAPKLEWDDFRIAMQLIPGLYQYLRVLEQCKHESAVSPDGTRRSSPLRCTACGALVY